MAQNDIIANTKPTVAIIGAGASGLMVADVLRHYAVNIHVYEQKPSPARKLLMAGKSGLNISHAEPLNTFLTRYDSDWLTPYIQEFHASHIQDFMKNLGIDSFVGSTGRIFPTMMKASPLLRAWLNELQQSGVRFFYRHTCENIVENQATFRVEKSGEISTFTQTFDAIILATGGLSWSRLGSDGKWQSWLKPDEITPFYPSNVGVCRSLSNPWSSHLTENFGKALKRVKATVQLPNGDIESGFGDIILTHYGMESGLIYRLNAPMREQLNTFGKISPTLDLLPDISIEKLLKSLQQSNKPSLKKQTLNNLWRKAGLDPIKIALLREIVAKSDWHNAEKMAFFIKNLSIEFASFRPIDEAISSGGGVKRSALTDDFQLKSNPYVFCCGEMLDWDAPTGGYLLTACFATGRAVGFGVAKYLDLMRLNEKINYA